MLKSFFLVILISLLVFKGEAQSDFRQTIHKNGEYLTVKSLESAGTYLLFHVSNYSGNRLIVFDTHLQDSVKLDRFYGDPEQYVLLKDQKKLVILTKSSYDSNYNTIPPNIFIYDLQTLKFINRISADIGWIYNIEDNKLSGVYNGKLKKLSLETGAEVFSDDLKLPEGDRFIENGNSRKNYFVALAEDKNKQRYIYWQDVESGNSRKINLPGSFSANNSVIGKNDQAYILINNQTDDYTKLESRVLVVNLLTGDQLKDISLPEYVTSLHHDDVSSQLLANSGYNSVVIDLNNSYKISKFKAGGNAAYWMPNGNSIFFVDYKGFLIYDINLQQDHFKVERDMNGSMELVDKVALDEKNDLLYYIEQNDDQFVINRMKLDIPKADVFDFSKLKTIKKESSSILPRLIIQDGHPTEPTDIVFSATGNKMISGDERGNIIIWDAASKLQWNKIQLRKKEAWNDDSRMLLAVHPLYEVIAASWSFGLIYFLDFDGNELARLTTEYGGDLIHFSQDGKYFFYEGADNKINVLSLADSKIISSYPLEVSGSIYSYAFNNTSSKIAMTTDEGLVRIVDALSGKFLDSVKTLHKARLRSVTFHPSGNVIASLDENGNVCVTDLKTKTSNKVLSRSDTTIAGASMIWQVIFDKKGNLLIPGDVGSENGSHFNIIMGLYDSSVNHFRDWIQFSNPESIRYFSKLVLGDDERTLWSAHTDNTLQVWDAEQKVHLKTILGNDEKFVDVYPGQHFSGLITGMESDSRSSRYSSILKKWDFAKAEIKPYDGDKFGTQLIRYNAKDSTYLISSYGEWKKIDLIKDAVLKSVNIEQGHNWIATTTNGVLVSDFDKQVSIINVATKKERILYSFGKYDLRQVKLDPPAANIYIATDSGFIAVDLSSGKKTVIKINLAWPEFKIKAFDVADGNIVFASASNLYTINLSSKKVSKLDVLSTNAIFSDTYYPTIIKLHNKQLSVFYQADTFNINGKVTMVLDVVDLITNQRQTRFLNRQEPLKKIVYSNDAKHIYLVYDKEIEIRNLTDATVVATIATLPENRFIIYTPDNYYFTSQKLTNVGFRMNENVFDISQFDLNFNRPDIVLERIGYADSSLVSLYKNAYVKRKNRSGVKELSVSTNIPELSITNRKDIDLITSNNVAKLSLSASTKNGTSLSRIFIHINDVPITGMRGWQLNNAANYYDSFSIKLTEGINKIKVFVTDDKGIASLKENVEIIYRPAQREKERFYFIGMGVSDYKDSSMNLTYADKDIKDLDALFKSRYKDAVSVIKLNHNATAKALNDVRQTLLQTNEADMVVVSLSGHGLLNKQGDFFFASHETDFNAPDQTAISFSSLEWLLDSIPARRKLLLIDACHSGEVDRSDEFAIDTTKESIGNSVVAIKPKGITIRRKKEVGLDNSFSLMQELFNDLGNANGSAVISAAGGLEFALETAEYQNGVFTYALITGLKEKKADADSNGSITIQEIKTWLSNEVFRLTKGRQKPTSRAETIDNNWVIW